MNLRLILQIIAELLGLGSDMAKNKAQKIPMQEDAIKARADLKEAKLNNRTERKDDKYQIKKWKHRVQLYDLKFLERRQAYRDIKDIIKAGGKIQNIQKTDDDVLINYELNGEKHTI